MNIKSIFTLFFQKDTKDTRKREREKQRKREWESDNERKIERKREREREKHSHTKDTKDNIYQYLTFNTVEVKVAQHNWLSVAKSIIGWNFINVIYKH